MFLRSCVAKALSRGNGPRHSLHALALESDFIIICFYRQVACNNAYRVRFSTGSFTLPLNVEVPPRLYQFLSQAVNSDAIPDDVLLGEVEANPQPLQVCFVKAKLLLCVVNYRDFLFGLECNKVGTKTASGGKIKSQ